MLATIIVNYKNETNTIEYIKNQLSKCSLKNIVIVINNGADNESNKKLIDELHAEMVFDIDQQIDIKKTVYVIVLERNLGFAKANNIGVEFLRKNFDIKYLLFSNNDIEFNEGNVIELLIDKIKSIDEVAVIGPKVIGLNGEFQSPEPYIPFWKKYFFIFWLTPFITKKIKNKLFNIDYSLKAKEGIHYKLMGSFLLIKIEDFINCGMMDENTFLFAEETILTERLSKIGKYMYYYPQVSVLHRHSETISKFYNERKKMMLQFKSESYYYASYIGISRFSMFIGKLSTELYCLIKYRK